MVLVVKAKLLDRSNYLFYCLLMDRYFNLYGSWTDNKKGCCYSEKMLAGRNKLLHGNNYIEQIL